MSRIADALEKAGLAGRATVGASAPLSLESFSAHDPSEQRERTEAAAPPAPVRTPMPAPAPSTAPTPTAAATPGAVRLASPHVWPNALTACADNERLILSKRVSPIAAQQYRKLASTLHQIQVEGRLRSVLVTSALAGEGKTVTAANLALMLSQSFFRRVLLIDADLRRPGLQNLFGINVTEGLSTALATENEPVAPLIAISQRLSLLTAGRVDRDPVGALSSQRMRDLLEAAVESFDWVIVDSPPIGLFPDAELLSMVLDGIVMVVRAESTPLAQIRRAVTTLTPERIVGAVLNQTEKVALVEHGYYNDDDRYDVPDGDPAVPRAGGAGA